MAAGGREADSAGERLNRARGVAVKMDGKVDRVLGGSGREVRRWDGEAWPEQSCSGSASARRELEEGEGNGSDRDGHWEWIRWLMGNEVCRDGRRVASPARRRSAAWHAYGVTGEPSN